MLIQKLLDLGDFLAYLLSNLLVEFLQETEILRNKKLESRFYIDIEHESDCVLFGRNGC